MPPLIVAAAITAAAGIGSSVIGSHAQSAAQKRAEQSPLALAQTNQANQQIQYGKESADIAHRLFPQYESGIADLTKYYKSLTGSSNEPALQAIAPLVRARKLQTQASLRNADLLPRGGARGTEYGRIYDNENSDILDSLTGARNKAWTDRAALTGDVGSRAQGLLGQAGGLSSSAASILGLVGSQGQAAAQRAGENSSALAGGLGEALGPIIIELMRRGGSSGSGRGGDAVSNILAGTAGKG